MKRNCERCNGWGTRFNTRSRKLDRCDDCDGAGEFEVNETWRPYEQHNGKCARCGRYTSASMGCPNTCKPYNVDGYNVETGRCSHNVPFYTNCWECCEEPAKDDDGSHLCR